MSLGTPMFVDGESRGEGEGSFTTRAVGAHRPAGPYLASPPPHLSPKTFRHTFGDHFCSESGDMTIWSQTLALLVVEGKLGREVGERRWWSCREEPPPLLPSRLPTGSPPTAPRGRPPSTRAGRNQRKVRRSLLPFLFPLAASPTASAWPTPPPPSLP